MAASNETLTTTEAKRPTFLTVLCILSFIVIAMGIIASLTQYFAMAEKGNMLNNFGGSKNKDLAASFGALVAAFGVDFEKMGRAALIQAFVSIPIFIGVLLMWKQKKIGFYVYIVSSLVQPIIPLLMGIELLGDLMTMATWSVIVTMVFIVLYGLNLKHMT
jgi:hypothetical protein